MSAEHLEEIEVLKSIFDGDDCFKVSNDKSATVQYLFGAQNESKSFLLEFEMVDLYPSASGPALNLDLFYNKNLMDDVKDAVKSRLNAECEQYLGSPMVYSLIEYVKENLENLLADQPTQVGQGANDENENSENNVATAKNVDKKEHLSKAQKRKMWNRGEGGGEKERGWNWIDIVKHLSQTGGADLQQT